jgi:hypothetical protein
MSIEIGTGEYGFWSLKPEEVKQKPKKETKKCSGCNRTAVGNDGKCAYHTYDLTKRNRVEDGY